MVCRYIHGVQVLKLSDLIINRSLYSWLEEISSHDGILILISITGLITPLDRGQ